jgi:hypothetical protein
MLDRRTTVAALTAMMGIAGPAEARQPGPTLFELRNYRTQPGQRGKLITMFEAHFLDAYQAAGAAILGSFENVDDPNRWMWIRAFSSAEQRAEALNGFYGSLIWKQLRGPANATIVDVGDALLLQALSITQAPMSAPDPGTKLTTSVIECVRYFPKNVQAAGHIRTIVADMQEHVRSVGGLALATLETSGTDNFYPRLPVRTESAIVQMTRFQNAAAQADSWAARRAGQPWKSWMAACENHVATPVERFRLRPTSRSALR